MKIERMLTRGVIAALITVFIGIGFALPASAKTYRWQPSSWLPSGVTWDTIEYMSDYVKRMSNGRIAMKPSAPGAIVPVPEQLEATSMGVMQANFIWPGYFSGELPIAFLHGDGMAITKTRPELRYLYEVYEGGRIMEILREEYAKHGVHLVGNIYWTLNNMMISKKPISGIADMKKLKFRTSDLIALQLAKLGAGTIWTPGTEVYTMLSTGGVDAITFSHAADDVAMGFHEVTKYWVKDPYVIGPVSDALIVNLDTWNSLSDDLKAILEAACRVGTAEHKNRTEKALSEAWDIVEKKGIEIVKWSDEDAAILAKSAQDVVPEKYFKDQAFKEMFSIMQKYAVEKGYWEKK